VGVEAGVVDCSSWLVEVAVGLGSSLVTAVVSADETEALVSEAPSDAAFSWRARRLEEDSKERSTLKKEERTEPAASGSGAWTEGDTPDLAWLLRAVTTGAIANKKPRKKNGFTQSDGKNKNKRKQTNA
jgi:hypothetical protein